MAGWMILSVIVLCKLCKNFNKSTFYYLQTEKLNIIMIEKLTIEYYWHFFISFSSMSPSPTQLLFSPNFEYARCGEDDNNRHPPVSEEPGHKPAIARSGTHVVDKEQVKPLLSLLKAERKPTSLKKN